MNQDQNQDQNQNQDLNQDQLTNCTLVVFCLDESGSMQPTANDTRGGINGMLESQKNEDGCTLVTLVTFSYKHRLRFSMKNINNVEPLTTDNYQPSGGTALYDGWAFTMNHTSTEISKLPTDQRPNKVVFVVVTDGEENSSLEWTYKQVIGIKDSHPDWEFIYLGANQDAIKEGAKYGVKQCSAMNYRQGNELNAYKCVSQGISRYRRGASNNVQFTQAERQASMEPVVGHNADSSDEGGNGLY